MFATEIEAYLNRIRELTLQLLQRQFQASDLKERFLEAIKTAYPPSLQLPHAYLALVSYLIGGPSISVSPSLLPNGSTLLDLGDIDEGSRIPELTRLAELGSLWMILGYCLKEESLAQAGVRVAIWQTYTLDHLGTPHLSLWAQAINFNPSRLAAYHELLFSLAYKLTGRRGFQEAAELHKRRKKSQFKLPLFLLSLVPEVKPFITPFFGCLAEEMTLGFLKFTRPRYSITCSLSGWNSGLFSWHKRDVAIVNFAPQPSPFDEFTSFGICRGCAFQGNGFKEIVWEKGETHFRLKGWTRLAPSLQWAEVDFHYIEQCFHLCIKENKASLNAPFPWVFYVNCKRVLIGDEIEVKSNSLEKYEGLFLPITLEGEQDSISIDLNGEASIEVVPLAGGEYFFGSNFLIACSIQNETFLSSFVMK